MARRGRHGLLAVGVLLGIYLLLGACTDVLPRPTFVVGAIYPLTGPQSQGGAQELAGVRAPPTLAGSNVHPRVISAETPAAAQTAVAPRGARAYVPRTPCTSAGTPAAPAPQP